MNEQKSTKGQCLCGAVKLEAKAVNNSVGACHCSTCRKWVGGPFMAVECGTDVVFTGEDSIGVYASSEWAERGFCSQCGSSLYYKLKAPGLYMIPAGVLDIESSLDFSRQVFVDEKPDYYCFANHTQDMTGAEVFAQFGG